MPYDPDSLSQTYDFPATYEIRVRGHIGPEWSEWFDGFTIIPVEVNETMLRGQVIDQPALHGLLGKICELGLSLLLVVRYNHQSPGKNKEVY